MNLYISRQGQTLGPFSDEQVRQQVNSGALSLDDMACPVGAQQWLPIRQVLPPASNQPAPPPPAAYPPAGYPSAAYAPGPSHRSRWWLIPVVLLLVAAGAAGVWVYLLPCELTVAVSRIPEKKKPSADGIENPFDLHDDATEYKPTGAEVFYYKNPSYSFDVQTRPKLLAIKTYIQENQGRINEDKLRVLIDALPAADRYEITDGQGQAVLKVPKGTPYFLVVLDHATVKGTTMANFWWGDGGTGYGTHEYRSFDDIHLVKGM